MDGKWIIIVTYNAMNWLPDCLRSCQGNKVVIVDNNSTDQTVDYIKQNFSNVYLLPQKENLGFGQANNVGMSYALNQGAERVFLLNQDAYLIEDVLDKLCEFQIKHPNYGILSPIHITGSRDKLDFNFANFMRKEITGQFYSDFVLNNDIASVYEVPFVNAAAWLISRDCLEAVGGFDPIFFHYGEDDNFCQRVLYHDFKIGVVPNAYIIHDREFRETKRYETFSKPYFKEVEKNYKLECANILKENTILVYFKSLECKIRTAFLKFEIRRANNLMREMALLSKIKSAVEQSRKLNTKRAPHYLNLK